MQLLRKTWTKPAGRVKESFHFRGSKPAKQKYVFTKNVVLNPSLNTTVVNNFIRMSHLLYIISIGFSNLFRKNYVSLDAPPFV